MLTRTTLRAPRDNRPLTQGTEIRYSAAQNPNNTQGAEVKRRMAGSLGNRTSTRVEGFNVATVSASASARPESYTAEVIDVGPSESESTFVGSLGLGGDSGETAPAAAKPSISSGRRSGRKRQKDKLPTTNQLVKRDIKRYGNTVPKGSFGSGSLKTIKSSPGSKVDTNVARHKVGRSKDQPPTKKFQKRGRGQGSSTAVLGRTTRRQGEQPKGPAVNLSNYKDNREKQKKLRDAKRKEAKKKAEARKKKTESNKPTGFGGLTSRRSSSRRSGSKSTSRGARGSSSSRSRGGASRGGSRSNSGSKSASRGARGSSSSRSRGGVSRGASRRTNRSRSRRRCDIRCKFDISILTNQNLMRDDLADVAYFVRTLKKINE